MRGSLKYGWFDMIIAADAADNVCGAKKFMWSKIASHVKYVTFQNSPYLSFGKVFDFLGQQLKQANFSWLKIARFGVNG